MNPSRRILLVFLCLFAWDAGPVRADSTCFRFAGQSLRGYASTLAAEGDLAYVTMGSALVVFDVSDPAGPREIGRAYAPTCYDARSTLARIGTGRYLVASSDLYGWHVFDVSDCDAGDVSCEPALWDVLFDPQGERTWDSGGGVFFRPDGLGGGHLFCANGGRGLRIYEAETAGSGELEGFRLLGVFAPEPAQLPWPNGIGYYLNLCVDGHTAYVAARESGLHVWDVTDPGAPVFLGYSCYNPLSPVLSVAVRDGLAVIGRSAFVGQCGLESLDVADPAHPVSIGCKRQTDLFGLDYFRDLAWDPERDLLAAANSHNGFFLFGLADDPLDPQVGAFEPLDLWKNEYEFPEFYAGALAMDYPRFLWAAGASGFAVSHHDPDTGYDVATAESDDARGLAIVESAGPTLTAFVADGMRGLVAVDVTDPEDLQAERPVTGALPFRCATGIGHKDGYLYVADRRDGLHVYRITGADSVAPVPPTPRATFGEPRDVLVYQDYLFVADGDADVTRYCIADPSNPSDPQTLPLPGLSVTRLAAHEDRVYAMGESDAAGQPNFHMIDPHAFQALGQGVPIPAERTQTAAFLRTEEGALLAYVGVRAHADSGEACFVILDATEPPAQVAPEEMPCVAVANSIGDWPWMAVRSLEVIDGMLVVQSENSGFYAFDLTDPLRPVQTDERLLSGNNNAWGATYRDPYFFDAHGDAGLYAIQWVPPEPSPVIHGLTPDNGGPGTAVTISGLRFGAFPALGSVTFNGTPAGQVLACSPERLVAPVPAAATTGPVVVTVNGRSSNGVPFQVTQPPYVSGAMASGLGAASAAGSGLFNELALLLLPAAAWTLLRRRR